MFSISSFVSFWRSRGWPNHCQTVAIHKTAISYAHLEYFNFNLYLVLIVFRIAMSCVFP